MSGLTQNQILAICVGALNFLASSSAQLTTLFGAADTSYIVSAMTLVGGVISIVLAVTSGQGATVKQVLAMPGVEKVTVNAAANATLAQIAVAPDNPKIEPLPNMVDVVTKIAKAG